MADRYLVDSSFLYALFDHSDKNHEAVINSIRPEDALFIPEVTLTEVAFLFRRSGGVSAAADFLDNLMEADPLIVGLQRQDFTRAAAIMRHYNTAQFDFVDCCVMALSERLDLTKICTFDRRDFSIFRPNHSDWLELVP